MVNRILVTLEAPHHQSDIGFMNFIYSIIKHFSSIR